jgi:hypothetical protein
MDWSNYPAPESGYTGDTLLESVESVAVMIGGGEQAVQRTLAVFEVMQTAAALGLPQVPDCLALVYPREAVAWQVYRTFGSPVTVEVLLAQLTATGDVAVPTPGELTPVVLDRVQVAMIGGTTPNVILRYKPDQYSPYRTFSQMIEAASCSVDPRIINGQPLPARATVLIDVVEPQVPAGE